MNLGLLEPLSKILAACANGATGNISRLSCGIHISVTSKVIMVTMITVLGT